MSSRTGNVKLAFRIRPPESQSAPCAISIDEEGSRVSVRNASNDPVLHHFSFDRVYDESARQAKVYKEMVSPFVADFMAGRNCCVFVYGQSGSGKTYTTLGLKECKNGGAGHEVIDESSRTKDADDFSSLGSAGMSRGRGVLGTGDQATQSPPPGHIVTKKGEETIWQSRNEFRRFSVQSDMTETGGETCTPLHEDSGIAPRIFHEMFSVLRGRRMRNLPAVNDDPKLSFSCVEVYDERIIDILQTDSSVTPGDENVSLSVKSSLDQGMQVEGAVEMNCHRESDAYDAIEVALRIRDQRIGITGATRDASHLVLILKLERYSKSRGKRTTANLFLVDLASSELVRRPPPDARPRFVQECRSVKKSLGVLRKCIRCLSAAQTSSIPYGESVLTKILHNGLQRGSGISFVVTAKPEAQYVQESLSAIRFGIYIACQKAEYSENSMTITAGNGSGIDGTLVRRDSLPVLKPSSMIATGGSSNPDSLCDSSDTFSHLSLRRQSEKFDGHPVIDHARHSNSFAAAQELMASVGDISAAIATLKTMPSNENFQKELSVVVATLNNASATVEAQLKQSGMDESLSIEEMELQLDDLAKELENIKFGGHLASQIQNEVQDAHLSLKRLLLTKQYVSHKASNQNVEGQKLLNPERAKVGYSNIREDRSTPAIFLADAIPSNGFSLSSVSRLRLDDKVTEAESLRAELVELRKAHELLQQQHDAKAQELANARQEIQELKTETNICQSKDVDGEENDGNKVSNNITSLNLTPYIEDTTDDWDENRVDVGAAPICVCLRLRPMTKLERNRRSRSCIEVHEGGREFTVDSPLDGEYDFCFDHVFDTESTQEEVYDIVGAPIVDDLLGGVNCAVMVYGLAGSGKTHTLAGKLPEMLKDDYDDTSNEESSSGGTPTEQDAGFSPRLVADLFRGMKDSPNTIEFRITCSYVCIYLEKVYDLLDPRFDKTLIAHDSPNGVYVEGAVEAFCFVEEDIIHLIRRGAACRRLIGNKLAIDSGRSHSILILNIEQHHIQSRRIRRSYLQLIELAGFEVTSKAKGQSVQETKIIHKSFSALGNVIKSLSEGNSYAPYRESKLTSIVKEALGGNCKTTMFITASPSSYHISETINSIRLGQRVRRVTNNPRVNIDASINHYRKWLLESEIRLNELSGMVKQMAGDLVDASGEGSSINGGFSSEIWQAIQALASEEESKANPCRKALLFDEEDFMELGKQKWRALTVELARRLPSEKLHNVAIERNRFLSMLSDIQSECVVLRRQNEILATEERKFEEQLASARRENRDLTQQIYDVNHRRQLAENRAKDVLLFLRYMRTLCWKLKKDIELDRPIAIDDIMDCLQGAPDLTGLVDLEMMMIESGIVYKRDVDVERMEKEYFDYLQQTGLLIDEEQVAAEEEVDELAFLDEDLGAGPSDSRWRKAHTGRFDRIADRNSSSIDESRKLTTHDTFLGLTVPWFVPKPPEGMRGYKEQAYSQDRVRNTRGERELHRDLQNMANKCVDLQLELNHLRQFLFSLTGKSTTLKMKNLSQECVQLAKERDRVVHNAKAATWKLHELHVVNKLLLKQVEDAKVQISFLEEGFQRLQDTFRTSIQEAVETEQSLRERLRAMQSVVDSLTEPYHDELNECDDSDSSSDGDSIGSANPLLDKIHLPLRGRQPSTYGAGVPQLVDPSSSQSKRRCLLHNYIGKRIKKRSSLMTHRPSKVMRRSFKLGTALIGEQRTKLQRAYDLGKQLVLPMFLEDDEDRHDEDEETHYTEDYHYRDGDDYAR